MSGNFETDPEACIFGWDASDPSTREKYGNDMDGPRDQQGTVQALEFLSAE